MYSATTDTDAYATIANIANRISCIITQNWTWNCRVRWHNTNAECWISSCHHQSKVIKGLLYCYKCICTCFSTLQLYICYIILQWLSNMESWLFFKFSHEYDCNYIESSVIACFEQGLIMQWGHISWKFLALPSLWNWVIRWLLETGFANISINFFNKTQYVHTVKSTLL